MGRASDSARGLPRGARQRLLATNRSKRMANLLYVDAITLARVFVDLCPAPVRNWLMRRVFTRSDRGVVFDRRVYVKFPWLVSIGRDTSVNRGTEFFGDFGGRHGIRIGAECYIAPHVRFLAAGHDLADLEQHVGGDIVVGDGVWIGAGATILPGVRIGDRAVVAAGSVVTKDVEADVIVGGVPATAIRSRTG